jgi:hypothetical protein
MKTVLYEIHLLNDYLVMHGRVFNFLYQNKLCGERARQRRDRKRESMRDSVLLEMRDSVSNKIDCWRNYVWQMWEINMR